MIVDPRGEVLAAAQAEEAAIEAIDLEAIQRERRRSPAAAPAPGRALPGQARRQDGLAPGVTGRDQGFLPTRNQVTISPLPLTSIGPRRSEPVAVPEPPVRRSVTWMQPGWPATPSGWPC